MSKIQPVIAQLDLQTSWFLNALENISEEESNTPFSEQLNPVKWVAGHLADARFTINAIVSGSAVNEHYKKIFGKGTSNKVNPTFPSIEQLKADWITISEQLNTNLQHLPEAKLLSKPPFQTAITDETLGGLIAYFATHESFHIGQISIYRKLLGKKVMGMGYSV